MLTGLGDCETGSAGAKRTMCDGQYAESFRSLSPSATSIL